MKIRTLVPIAIAAWLLPSHGVLGAMFLKIDGVDGESQDQTHANEIEIQSFSWGAIYVPGSAGGGAGKVSMQDLSLVRRLDKASPQLMLACATGKHFPEAVLVCRKSGDPAVEYYKITLSDVLVSSVQTGGSAGDTVPTESVSLNFTKIKWEYVPVDATGTAQEPVVAEYDLRTATAIEGVE
jgi:type VI secretion system secreted protein Hcp